MTDEATVAQLIAEMRARPDMELVLHPATAFALVGVVQLAMRHPGMTEQRIAYDGAQRFLRAARLYFADAPTVLGVIDRGDDPGQDAPPPTNSVPSSHRDDPSVLDRGDPLQDFTVRTATDAEQRAAIATVAAQLVAEGAAHDCGEWLVCRLCGREVRS